MLEHDAQRLLVERSGAPLSTVKMSDIINLIGRGHADIARPDQPLAFPSGLLETTIATLNANGDAPFANVGTRELAAGGTTADGLLVVHNTERLLRCFASVASDGVVGVVDDNGVLVGNVSAWDLKFCNHHSLVSFSLPLLSFLKSVRAKMMAPEDYLVTVKLSSTVGSLLKKFAENHVDRIYVVDDDGKPIGVVSNAELLRVLKSN
eukprot:TRINITY_DN2874_c0_g1_i1.p2 TRINITY_DN2874_c0_g1~~TRINITY_DN2874_c0_g1_i1.p2  ORF type:complete len:207 (-),score=132.58 TRINITY_DN2874_c0_g1_i1:62-682(-)